MNDKTSEPTPAVSAARRALELKRAAAGQGQARGHKSPDMRAERAEAARSASKSKPQLRK